MATRVRTMSDVADPWTGQMTHTEYAATCVDPSRKFVTTSDVTGPGKYEFTTMEDVVTPRFKTLSSRGGIINSPMKRVTIKETSSIPVIDHTYVFDRWENCSPTGRYLEYGGTSIGEATVLNLLGVGTPLALPFCEDPITPAEKASFTEQAITAAWSEVDLSDHELLQSIGEARESYDLLVGAFRNLLRLASISDDPVRFAKWVRKKKNAIKNSKNLDRDIIDQVSDLWMLLRYGLRPLAQEVISILNAWNGSIKRGRKTFRGSKMLVKTADEVLTNKLISGDSGCQIVSNCTQIFNVRSGVLTDVELTNPLLVWGIQNPVSSAYALARLSFVLDWFVNVGKLVRSWEPKVGFRVLSSWVVTELITTHIVYGRNPFSDVINSGDHYPNFRVVDNHYHYLTVPRFTKVTTEKERLPNPPRPVRPHISVNLNLAKVFDLACIAKNIFSSRR